MDLWEGEWLSAAAFLYRAMSACTMLRGALALLGPQRPCLEQWGYFQSLHAMSFHALGRREPVALSPRQSRRYGQACTAARGAF